MWWKVKFSLFITLSCLIPALWKAQHLLRLIQHQSMMKACLFSIWHLARSHLHYIRQSFSLEGQPCKEKQGDAHLAFLMSTTPSWSHFLSSVNFELFPQQ